jgi:hypothetical protein
MCGVHNVIWSYVINALMGTNNCSCGDVLIAAMICDGAANNIFDSHV